MPENIIACHFCTDTGCRDNRVFGICLFRDHNLGDGRENSLQFLLIRLGGSYGINIDLTIPSGMVKHNVDQNPLHGGSDHFHRLIVDQRERDDVVLFTSRRLTPDAIASLISWIVVSCANAFKLYLSLAMLSRKRV
jgi:hypothetical protein